jgi:flavin reductase (DIM6/NTAB) family NADH-FMN oxidoreductase RutF
MRRLAAMKKQQLEPGTFLYPLPAVMVSCQGVEGKANIVTIAWTGVMASKPPMVGIGVRRSRYSYQLIKDTGEFVINIPNRALLSALDLCGTVSGRDVDKFAETGLSPVKPASLNRAPLIAECPVNLECRVTRVLELGSHDYLVGEVVAAHFAEDWLDSGKPRPAADELIAYARGVYYGLGEELGQHGFSLRRE